MSMTTATFGTLPGAAPREEREKDSKTRRLPLIDEYLKEQQTLTAVTRFAQLHERDALPAQARYYESLLPLDKPKLGQQYAFSVDLDRCTGCKACVTACHNLNGLDEGETWRSVGLLHGGSRTSPMQQTVTTACHHCIEPACLAGCPVNAYEKDPLTGIVRHLDDQCIGCQYCTLTCPYDVPQFNKKLGIVRKCDMCSDRLAVGEAPACVQACPNEAIAIRIVDTAQIVEDVQADAFLPGAPSPGITLPTTEYKTKRVFPKNTLPADFYNVRPAHNHFPLVVLLVLTQLSVGAFSVDYVVTSFFHSEETIQRYHALVALALGLIALVASTTHLGRPQYGFRAIMGIGHSWMSREIAGFGAFAGLAVAYATGVWANPLLASLGLPMLDAAWVSASLRWLGASVVLSGLLGVGCSVMLYAVTRRAFWKMSQSGPRFFATTAVLGTSLTLLVFTAAARAGEPVPGHIAAGLNGALIAFSVFKLLHELSIFSHLRLSQSSDLKRTALLMRGELAPLTQIRFLLGVVGGIVLPFWLSVFIDPRAAALELGTLPLAITAFGALCLTAGEFVERSLFFMAAAAPKMPGAVGK
ncbi:MAG TPA: DmsC/YnfH family molybdoenzyme membrane anchor subunit [Polyangiaceae bacterium]|nr:DmsC/YnfH family molybdoenzyme membrane anchor subunit [Polyangiaceae bacterium]